MATSKNLANVKGSGGAKIIQLNTVESQIQGTAFLNLSYCFRTRTYYFIYCFNILFCQELSVSVSFQRAILYQKEGHLILYPVI